MTSAYTRQAARNKPFAILTKKQSQPEDVLRIVGFSSITKVTSDPAELGLEWSFERADVFRFSGGDETCSASA